MPTLYNITHFSSHTRRWRAFSAYPEYAPPWLTIPLGATINPLSAILAQKIRFFFSLSILFTHWWPDTSFKQSPQNKVWIYVQTRRPLNTSVKSQILRPNNSARAFTCQKRRRCIVQCLYAHRERRVVVGHKRRQAARQHIYLRQREPLKTTSKEQA